MATTKGRTAAQILEGLAEIKAGMRKAPRRHDDDEEAQPGDKSALLSRVRDLTRQRNEAEAKLQQALDAAAELRAAQEQEAKTLREEAAKSVTEGVKRVEETYALRDLMHEPDDDGVAAMRRAYEAIPEAKRPASIVEYAKGLDAKTAPKAVRPYLKPAEEEDADETSASGSGQGQPRQEQEPAARQPKKAPPVDEGRGKGKAKDLSELSDEEYEKYLSGERLKSLTLDMGR